MWESKLAPLTETQQENIAACGFLMFVLSPPMALGDIL